jgi:hypothetical protein
LARATAELCDAIQVNSHTPTQSPTTDYCTNNNTQARQHRHHDIDDDDTNDTILRPYIDSTSDALHDSPHPPLDLDLHLHLPSAPQ